MADRVLYLIPATRTTLPIVSDDLRDLEGLGDYVTVPSRGESEPQMTLTLPGLVHMTRSLVRDAKRLGVDIEVIVDTDIERTIITRGRAELLAAIKERINYRGTYATGILGREEIKFGDMLDLDIAIGHALEDAPMNEHDDVPPQKLSMISPSAPTARSL